MITQVESVEISLSANAATIKLNTDKRYKILLKDYENLPFVCTKGSPLENITIDVDKIGLSVTNGHFDGDTVAFLRFLSRKYTLYSAAMSKAAYPRQNSMSTPGRGESFSWLAAGIHWPSRTADARAR